MSKLRNSKRSGLFLIELIVAILFFSLASAICIQLFVKAHIISTESKDLSMAMNQAQVAAESFKASDGSFENIKDMLKGKNGETKNEIILQYDKDWNIVNENAFYELSLMIDENNPITAVVCIQKCTDKVTPIYTIEMKKYLSK